MMAVRYYLLFFTFDTVDYQKIEHNRIEMNAKRITLTGLMILVLGLLACGKMNKWKVIETKEYAISYPDSWTMVNNGQTGIAVQLFSALTSREDKFSENVNLVIQDLSGQTVKTLDQYTQLSESQIGTMMTNARILSSCKASCGGQECQKVIWTAVQGMFKLKFEQYYLIKNEKAYVLTLTCAENQFDDYREVGEKIMDSFKLK